jgi:hypothetical protein
VGESRDGAISQSLKEANCAVVPVVCDHRHVVIPAHSQAFFSTMSYDVNAVPVFLGTAQHMETTAQIALLIENIWRIARGRLVGRPLVGGLGGVRVVAVKARHFDTNRILAFERILLQRLCANAVLEIHFDARSALRPVYKYGLADRARCFLGELRLVGACRACCLAEGKQGNKEQATQENKAVFCFHLLKLSVHRGGVNQDADSSQWTRTIPAAR